MVPPDSLTPEPSRSPDPLLPVLGQTMGPVVARLRAYSRQHETLLLCGATGVGKSRLARWCHQQSPRAPGPFEVVDLSSVPEDLQLGHLFGWRKGAYTSAVSQSEGACGRALGGTLFIDEIDKLSFRTQAGLLEVLEQRTYRPLGMGGKPLSADVRFIVGTNADLRAAVAERRFREDLYYRINVLPVRVPPLAERSDEIVPWARYMLQRRHEESGPSPQAARFASSAEALLQAQRWPGNLRELDNTVRRAYALARMDREGTTPELVLDEAHVRDALEPALPDERRSLLALLDRAAREFVAEAVKHHRSRGQPPDLDLLAALRGFALNAAIETTGSVDAALELFGRASLLVNRNHHKFLAAEWRRVEGLCAALGEPSPEFLRGLGEHGIRSSGGQG